VTLPFYFGLIVLLSLGFPDLCNAQATVTLSTEQLKDRTICNKVDCSLHGSCLNCTFPNDCRYGVDLNVSCITVAVCAGEFSVIREAQCRFCYQLDPNDYICDPVTNCSVTAPTLWRTVCRVRQRVICMGHRTFYKKIRCNWTSGYKWSTAMFLSVTLGGFGVDRFYLGHWKSAIGKLFSFGGLGIWTVLDVILIAVGYITPADGSVYM